MDGSSIFGYPCLDSRCLESSWKFLRFSLDSFADWNGKNLLIDQMIEFKVVIHFLFSFFKSGVGGMAFLPKELSGSNEGSGVLELPSDDVGPLIQFQGKVSMTLDPIGVCWIHDGLAGRTNGNWFSEVALS